MKNNSQFVRAKSMVVQDKFDFRREQFSKDLQLFLSNYFQFEALRVDVCEGHNSKMLICVEVTEVKKTHVV